MTRRTPRSKRTAKLFPSTMLYQSRYLSPGLRDPNTRGGSAFRHDRVQQGDTLTISQPRNLFALARDARRSIVFAGGIGVTPILAMAERLAQLDAPFELHYCGRSRSRTAFLDRISSSHFSKQAHFHFVDGPEEQRIDVKASLASPSRTEERLVGKELVRNVKYW